MLTDEEKNQVRLEEIFRHQVQEELKKTKLPTSHLAQLVSFLNTGLGLWFLSTLAVGIISWSYGEWSHYQESQRSTKEIIRKLDLEIGVRLRNFDIQINNANNLKIYYVALWGLEQPHGIVRGLPNTVFSEFSERSFRSLLWELYTLVPPSEKPEILGALRQAQALAERGVQTIRLTEALSAEDQPIPSAEIQAVKLIIKKEFNLRRWVLP